jgi:hypothetical protein
MRQAVVDLNSQPVRNRHPNPGPISNVNFWASNNTSLYTAAYVASGPGDGEPCFRTTRTATATPAPTASSARVPALTDTIPVTPGETIQASFAVKATVANRQLTAYMIFTDAGGAIIASNVGTVVAPLPTNTYARISTGARPVPANSVAMVVTWRVDTTDGTSTVAAGEECYFKQFRIDGAHDRYSDGNSYNWRWRGTAGASESVGYPEPVSYIRNRHPNPGAENNTLLGWSSNNGTNYPIALETDPAFVRTGIQAVRATRGGTATSTVSSSYLTTGSLTSWKVKPGETVYASVSIRAELPGRIGLIRFNFRDISGTIVGSSVSGPTSAIPVGSYGVFSFATTVPVGTDSAIALIDTSVPTGVATIGERIWMDDAMLVNGGPTDYANGDYPGWRWDGVPNRSESVGPPYKLDSIAGPPLATMTSSGFSADLGLSAFEARTLYVVHDVIDLNSNNYTIASVGGSTFLVGNVAIRPGATGSSNIISRVETNNGGAVGPVVSGTRTVGRHVSVGSVNQGITTARVVVDGSNTNTVPMVPGDGLDVPSFLNVSASTASDAVVVAIAYRGEHDIDTVKRVTAWLARKYGSLVPAGY